MATYAIGDIQGCYDTLERLLARIKFDPARDRLWLSGDLVNRGPRSLRVLRWACDNDARLVSVLGNHDLHLLAVAAGVRRPRRRDTLKGILKARDRDRLLDWLRNRPLVHRDGELVLVHAGLLPAWTVERALELAGELEAELRGRRWREALAAIYDAPAPPWSDDLRPPERWRAIASVLTRMRTCRPDGTPVYEYAGGLVGIPRGQMPWFRVPGRRHDGVTILFGHWAALGLHFDAGVCSLDTGCVWGGSLTAMRLDDREVFQEPLAD